MKRQYKGQISESLNTGITLIALIITIIIMLILAGVTLSMVLGDNGIINKSKQAVKVHDVATIKEALELEKAESYMKNGCLNLDDFLDQISECKPPIDSVSIGSKTDDSAEIIINGEHKFIITEDGNGDLNIEYVGTGKAGILTLSATSGTYTYPTSGTFTVTSNSTGGAISATSDAPNVATVSVSGNTIKVMPGTVEGKARIVVKSAAIGEYVEGRAIYIATVQNGSITISATPYTGTYDGSEHDALTNVSTNPTGTTIKYSTDGVNYDSTMPKIKDTSSSTVSVSASKEGYKTQTETYTVTVNKADGGLTLSETSGTLIYPTSGTFTVTNNTSGGTLSVSSNAPDVATASLSGNIVTVIPKSVGTAVITVRSAETSNYKEKTETYTVSVKQKTYTVGESVTIGGYNFYVIGDDGTNVKLLCKTDIGLANWIDAKSQARTFGSALGGSGRLLTKSEAEVLPEDYLWCSNDFWLEDPIGTKDAFVVLIYPAHTMISTSAAYGDDIYCSNFYTVRPVVIISSSLL